jgi:aspartate/tyrosine/aromatic aminotransferase
MERLQKLNLDLTSCKSQATMFSHVTMAPPDPILGTAIAYNNDKSADKVNLGIGAYRDDNGKPYIFKIVKKVEEEVQKTANHVLFYLKTLGILAN